MENRRNSTQIAVLSGCLTCFGDGRHVELRWGLERDRVAGVLNEGLLGSSVGACKPVRKKMFQFKFINILGSLKSQYVICMYTKIVLANEMKDFKISVDFRIHSFY